MFAGSLACMIHAFLPSLFVRTGSRTIERLHDRMVVNRRRHDRVPASSLAETQHAG